MNNAAKSLVKWHYYYLYTLNTILFLKYRRTKHRKTQKDAYWKLSVVKYPIIQL